jgi:hypothetical protein
MKVKIIQPSLDKKRQDSFWYDGQIAIIKTDHGVYSLEACGDIRVMFNENGNEYHGYSAVEEARNRNLTDEELNKLGQFDGWLNNNWFEVVLIPYDKNLGVISAIGDIADTYNDGIEMLKDCAKNEVYKSKLERLKKY